MGRSLGFNFEPVRPEKVSTLHSCHDLEGVLGAIDTPDDRNLDSTNVTMALATDARQDGVRIIRRCRATNIA